MENLKMEKATAIKIYRKASDEVRSILISTFGEKCFSQKRIDIVDSYEDAYELADKKTRKECEIFPTDTDDVIAYKKLKLIVKVINYDEVNGIEFIPDLKNTTQKKWYAVFTESSGSGFDFSASYYYSSATYTAAGLRLCSANQENCNYIAKKFLSLWKVYITFNN